MRRILAAGMATVSIGSGLATAGPVGAGHTAFHKYSTAWDGSDGLGTYTGVKSKRINRFISSANQNCQTYYQGSPVYQTQWAANAGSSTVEIGTGHQCNALPNGTPNFRYHFWGRQVGGPWYPIGQEQIGGETNIYEFLVQKFNATTYSYKIGGVQKATLTTPQTFDRAGAGLESYFQTTVTKYLITELAYSSNASTSWKSFSGQDFTILDPAPMCGSWNSPTAWSAGENVTC